MKARRVTKQYFQLEDGEKVYFFQPFEKPLTVQEIQALMDRSTQVIVALERMANMGFTKSKSRRAPRFEKASCLYMLHELGQKKCNG